MRKEIYILALLFSINAGFGCAFSNEANLPYVIKDGYNDYTCKFANDNIDLKTLDGAEKKILGKNYAKDNNEARLSRIESKIFGAIQSGSFTKRLNTINEYTNKCLISSKYTNPRFRRYRNGTLTGYSPPVYNYNNTYVPKPPKKIKESKIKRFFRNLNSPYYSKNYYNTQNPYINGNYNNIQGQRNIQLYSKDPMTDTFYGNGFYRHHTQGGNSGATVTILD